MSFTKEQFNYARYEANAVEYAKKQGYDLIKRGHFYVMREHNSMVFTQDGKWFWNSRGLKGRALEFVINYENLSLHDAVLALSGGKPGKRRYSTPKSHTNSNEENTEFILPKQAANYRKMFWYLCCKRKLDSEIVGMLVNDKMLYQSEKGMNAVFVSYDENGIARNAYQRGTWKNETSAPFKREVLGSDKTYPFCVKGNSSSDTVYVFEAAIDAISHASIYKMFGKDFKTSHRIALGGLDIKPLLYFLEKNPQVKNIVLCFDNDTAGIKQAAATCANFKETGKYTIHTSFPKCKDWNEDLQKLVDDNDFLRKQNELEMRLK